MKRSEIIEEIVNGKPMYSVGNVDVLDQPNFIIKVIKKTNGGRLLGEG
jgi:hypothetical protein